MLQAPTLPLAARTLNRAGRVARRIGFRLGSLDIDGLLAEVESATGLGDFGPDTFRAGLGRLLDSLEHEGRLTAIGRTIARRDVLLNLENRLRLVDWHRRHPDIGEQDVARPVFIVGMARTGTTILHHLVTQDPSVRVPLTWEVDRPFPPPEIATYDVDPRIDEVQKDIDRSESLIPGFKRMHPMGARLAQECVRITTIEFASMLFHTTYRVPEYRRWLHDEADLAPAYRMHRKMLQLLQWRCPRGRWILKSPAHLWAVEAMLAEYPDACLVQTHRDPLAVMSSLTSLMTTLRTMSGEPVDPLEIAREWSDLNARAFDRAVDARESGLVKPERVVDVHFREFVADPVATVRRIYERFDFELSDEAATRMRAHLSANPDDKHGKHDHRFGDTGLDVGEEREKVRRYQEYFDVPSEV